MKHILVIFPKHDDAIIEKELLINQILPVGTLVTVNTTEYMYDPKIIGKDNEPDILTTITRIDYISQIDTIYYISNIDQDYNNYTLDKILQNIYKKNKTIGFQTTWDKHHNVPIKKT